MANTKQTLANILALLGSKGANCAIFGGWAEELLGVREPWSHSDIDLLLKADSFEVIDRVTSDVRVHLAEIPAKKFKHKRAFIYDGVMCELLLVQNADARPITYFWGDTPFIWHTPLQHHERFELFDKTVEICSVENLDRYRRERASLNPNRWREPQSLVS